MKTLNVIYNILLIGFVFVLLYISAYIFHTQQKEHRTAVHINNKLTQEATQLNALNKSHALVAQSIYENILNQEDVLSILKKANRSYNDEEKESLRKELYEKLLPLYKNLKKQNISQLHFHLNGNISFLRFNRPEKFGDSLMGIRSSIDKVNRTKQPVHGFEGGKWFNGFRHVYPLLSNKKLIGTVEIAHSFNGLKKEAMEIYPAYYAFLLKKEVVDSKAWVNEATNYLPTILSSNYLLNKQTLDTLPPRSFSVDDLRMIDSKISGDASALLDEEQPFVLYTNVKGRDFSISFTPVKNTENKHVAYYISYQTDSVLSQIETDYELQLLLSAMITLAFSFLVVMYFRSYQKASQSLEALATIDPLTKIANRNQLHMVMQTSLQTALRYEIPLSLIFFDIDDFKRLNDQLGQLTGDEILIELSALVKHHIRSSDLLARWTGNQFIIVLTKTNQHQAEDLANKLRAIIAERSFVVTAHLTCSFGIAQLQKGDTEASLLKRVDTALSTAKKEGKNRVVIV